MKEIPPHEWHHTQMRLLSLEDRVTALHQMLRELTERIVVLEQPIDASRTVEGDE